MQVLFVSAEVAPYSKTGGLGDVAGALPSCLQAIGHDVTVVTPLYAAVRGAYRLHLVFDSIPIEALGLSFGAWLADDGRTWFVDFPPFYDRPSIYTNDSDEHRRFLLLTWAALELCRRRGWAPAIAHANDWQTGFLPLLLRSAYGPDPLFGSTRSVFTIHNLGYQGVFPASIADDIGLRDQQYLLHQDHLHQGRINFLEHALMYADAITTVSPTYAWEIQTPERGLGLDGLLRRRAHDLVGILNGIDTAVWDPRTDRHLQANYSVHSLDDKHFNKVALLERGSLDPRSDLLLVGVISRLTAQKGIELMIRPLARLLAEDRVRLAALGSGEEKYQEAFRWLAAAFPEKVLYREGYDEPLAHLIEGGADVFLMPSRYEPSGLNQMYSLSYGTPPVVRRTGGLADTVRHYDPSTGEGTGFVFDHYTEDGLAWALDQALAVFPQREEWRRLQRNGMAEDNSWERRGGEYDDLYRRLTEAPGP
ncbi:MAG TPA: glycogen synthase GlgA [Acidimicrobiia bacterium]|nr:glycogen synthase GlgA [Acidimicrobiia bacterium]